MRFNELPPIPGLEPYHFDLYDYDLFHHQNKSQSWSNRQRSCWIGRVRSIGNHVSKGPLVEYADGREAIHRIRLKQKCLMLNCCPPGMYSFDTDDSNFRANAQWYWSHIKPAVTDWWWTARFRKMAGQLVGHYGFVFASETDAIVCSQIIADLEPPNP